MYLNQKTLEELRDLINEKIVYRKGPELVKFFNELGFNDAYGKGFPSRWLYTQNKLEKINNTSDLDKCIKKLFEPINFVGDLKKLDTYIEEFNKYLTYDNWKLKRIGKEITFEKADEGEWENVVTPSKDLQENNFFNLGIKYDIDKLKINEDLKPIIKLRLNEIESCINYNIPLSTIFLAGSTLEGILLNYATLNLKEYNCAKSAPKEKDGQLEKSIHGH